MKQKIGLLHRRVDSWRNKLENNKLINEYFKKEAVGGYQFFPVFL
ncbi:MAG: hypothetical protein WBQ73_02770 [Candidatus Babeliales bacterium]